MTIPSVSPWLLNKSWAGGRIRSLQKKFLLTMWIITLVFLAVGVFTAFSGIGVILKGDPNGWLLFLFLGVGLLFLIRAIHQTLIHRKYGVSELELLTFPGVIGGQFVGIVRTPTKIRPEEGYRLHLVCRLATTTHHGKETRTNYKLLWEDQALIKQDLQVDEARTQIPVAFAIPADVQECSPADANPAVEWLLTVTAKTPGIDYQSQFTVPVFKVPDSELLSVEKVVDPIAAYRAPKTDEDKYGQKVQVQPLPTGGVIFYFPAGRQVALAVFLGSFIVGLLVVAFIIPYLAGIHFGTLLISVICVGFSLLLITCVFPALFRSYTLRVDPQAILLTIGGITRRTETIPAFDIEDIQAVRTGGMSSGGMGTGVKVRDYYRIDIHRFGGKQVVAAEYIDGKNHAEELIQDIRAILKK